MTAHDPTGSEPAHVSRRPDSVRPAHINVDETGVSMSWKTAVAILLSVVMAMLWWNRFSGSLASSEQLDTHIAQSDKVHQELRDEVTNAVKPVKAKVDDTETAVIEVKNGFYEQRAEDLAYRVIENNPPSLTPRQRVERFEAVKRKAVENQKAGKDIRTGIDAPVL